VTIYYVTVAAGALAALTATIAASVQLTRDRGNSVATTWHEATKALGRRGAEAQTIQVTLEDIAAWRLSDPDRWRALDYDAIRLFRRDVERELYDFIAKKGPAKRDWQSVEQVLAEPQQAERVFTLLVRGLGAREIAESTMLSNTQVRLLTLYVLLNLAEPRQEHTSES